jgi:hypothetical protein
MIQMGKNGKQNGFATHKIENNNASYYDLSDYCGYI